MTFSRFQSLLRQQPVRLGASSQTFMGKLEKGKLIRWCLCSLLTVWHTGEAVSLVSRPMASKLACGHTRSKMELGCGTDGCGYKQTTVIHLCRGGEWGRGGAGGLIQLCGGRCRSCSSIFTSDQYTTHAHNGSSEAAALTKVSACSQEADSGII